MISTVINQELGLEFPLFQGGMAWVADASLAAGVSNAGGLGIIAAMNSNGEQLRAEIKKCKELTDKPFGVNIMLQSPFADEVAQVVAEEKVPVVVTGAGNPSKYMKTWQAAGIKVVAFVAPTENYDALMLADDAKLADSLNMLAAKWIDEAFADAEDHSVPVAVFSCRTAQTGVTQADELIKIEEYSDKAQFAKEVELQDENTDTGMAAAENLYITNPEIKVFLSAHNGLALGINNYFTGLSSPVTDYANMGVFCVNGNEEIGKLIQDEKTPFRGMVLTGGVQDTCNEIRDVVTGIYDESLPSGTVTNATTLFVNEDTVEEYLETGNVTSLTEADFE